MSPLRLSLGLYVTRLHCIQGVIIQGVSRIRMHLHFHAFTFAFISSLASLLAVLDDFLRRAKKNQKDHRPWRKEDQLLGVSLVLQRKERTYFTVSATCPC